MSKTLKDLSGYRGLNFVHLNIRSLLNKIDLFRTTFHESNIQILGLSETWLSTSIPDPLVELPGYTLFRNDRNFNNVAALKTKKGGGVCLYLQSNLNGNISELNDMNISCEDVESQWLKVKFSKQRKIIVGNLHRPPQGKVKYFLSYLEECLEKIDYIHNDIIIMGDINIDFKDRKFEGTKELKEFLSQTGLTNHISTCTRYSTSKNSCLDHVYTNSNIINDCGQY